ncbi:hypothetical protein [Streptomyces antibioticus]|uniref:hypothetical protein n=1 Tax=Streptomyces antibioticus TaxID=1890 RepID=UPI0033C7D7FF
MDSSRSSQAGADRVGAFAAASPSWERRASAIWSKEIGSPASARYRCPAAADEAIALMGRSATSRTSTVLVQIGGAARMAPVSIAWVMRTELE